MWEEIIVCSFGESMVQQVTEKIMKYGNEILFALIFYNIVSDTKSHLSFPHCQQYCLIIHNNSNPEKTGGVNVAKIQFLKLSFRGKGYHTL